MKAERWQEVERLYHAALERGAEGRAAFLAEASAGDEGLRREVESLLAYEDRAENFIESPALEVAAKMMAEGQGAPVLAGQTINHYRVISPLGAGGMGEVYLASDTRLGRRVALKFLPAHFSQDKEHLRRFEQEARAVAALSHPNVCTIYEVVETGEGRHCIVMEHVGGVTLRTRMRGRRMSLAAAVDIALQIASALAAAHHAGIVHRDIKPENVMVRPDGLVKVLDFGIAKYAGPARGRDAKESWVKTATGVVVGTTAYMSPEQARGQAVDVRSDIWSLGVILYEMVARRLPFPGKTPSDRVAAILEREPEPLGRARRGVPAELERVVSRALAKDRDERYAGAADLTKDLRELRGRLGAEPHFRFALPAPARRLLFSRKRRGVALAALLLVIAAIVAGPAYLFFRRSSTPAPQTEIKLLAVLPLKSLNRAAGDDYLGLGIADTIITKVSRLGGLTVRPTSAVRKYADQEIDSLEAAGQLQADAVLDGTFLRAGDRLRVSVNLLRARDGASLWAESFDMRFTDIFAIQDEVSKQVAAQLQLRLSAAEQARLAKRHTTSPEAYSYYTKAMYHFSKRGFSGDPQEETDTAIDLFKKAIELDPNYALAHAQLGFAYAWLADFREGGMGLIASAKEALRVAERLDPQLAEVHVARAFIFWSHYEGWQNEAAMRELNMAKQLDPSTSNNVLPALYYHIGLEEQSVSEYELALERDPTSDTIKNSYGFLYLHVARPDDWLALNQRLFNRGPDVRYYLEKRMLKEAAPLVEETYVKNPDAPESRRNKALLLALQGKHREAQAAIPRILEKAPRDKGYHHYTYNNARIYALDGKSEEALQWLRITVKEGFPCYTLFARDPFLDPIRKDSAFIQFMSEMEARWEGYRREFG
ncbi:MAG TPA: protein kinase [Pyrinomonadaceae bacterium]